MSLKNDVKVLSEAMRTLAQCSEVTPKELLLCKELYAEIRILYLREEPKTDLEHKLTKSKAYMNELNANIALKI